MPIEVGSGRAAAQAAAAALQRVLDLFESVEAGFGEGVGLEDDVEPGDVVAVGGQGGLGADVPRLGDPVRRPGLANRLKSPLSGPVAKAACPAAG